MTTGKLAMINVLFVCLGNICRSPTAEGAFRDLVGREGLADRVRVDSAGTGAYHVGESPDHRAQEAARRRGINLSKLRARKATAQDFRRFDYIVAMDRENHRKLSAICPRGEEHRLYMFMDFAPDLGRREIPDPYYGGSQGFDVVLDLIDAAGKGLIEDIRKNHL